VRPVAHEHARRLAGPRLPGRPVDDRLRWPVVTQAGKHRGQIAQPPARRSGPADDQRIEPDPDRRDEEPPAAGPRRQAEIARDDVPLRQPPHRPVRIAEQAEIAAGIAAAPGHHRAHRRRVALAQRRHPVDHLVERAVAAHRDHQGHAGARGLAGERGGVAGPARLGHLEGERAAGQRVAQPRPQPPGAARAGRRIDDEEGGAGYVRPTRPPPMTCRNSVMDANRIIGF
jgi:hypothetical protein